MRRIPSFVYGNVIGGLITGIVGGAFLDLKAVVIFSALLAANAAIVSLVCWWRPGFEAAAWKLWLMATFANPLMLGALVFTIDQYECLIGSRTGWNCMFAGIAPLVAGVCLVPPVAGLALRWWTSRRNAPLSSSTAR
ncbi:MAG: hypothetical protein AB7F22_36845 [Reyranella sp.]|uniref:hypothetical protein n=1 Tax=Reyranella sp. TaxID=1929291 RepID=UPI003D10C3BB